MSGGLERITEGGQISADERADLTARVLTELAFGLPPDLLSPLREHPVGEPRNTFFRHLRSLPAITVAGEVLYLDEPAQVLYVHNPTYQALRGLPLTPERRSLHEQLVVVFGTDAPQSPVPPATEPGPPA